MDFGKYNECCSIPENFVEIGGKGCPVVGQVVLPEGLGEAASWGPFAPRIQTRSLELTAPNYPQGFALMRYQDQVQWRKDWYQSESGKAASELARTERRNERYAYKSGDVLASGSLDFEILFMESGRSDEAFDLGPIQLKEHRPLGIGQMAPSFDATDIHGKPLSLIGLQGRYVLLHFWQLVRPNTVDDVAALKQIADEFKNDERFVIVGITFGMPNEIVQKFTAHHQIPWIQIVLRVPSELGQYFAGSAEVNYLIGPDGTVLTDPLKVPDILDVVTKELSP